MSGAVVSTHDHVDIDSLVLRTQQGDAAAFDALFDAFGERVFRYVRSRVPLGEAEDITQRVFVRMIEGLPKFEQRGLPFASWLFRIAHNVIIDAARTRREHLPLEVADETISPRPGPADVMEAAADRVVLVRAIESLPPEQRDVIAYRFFADLSTRDIAALLGKHEGTVRVLQFRALRALRQRLAPRIGPRIDRVGLGEIRS